MRGCHKHKVSACRKTAASRCLRASFLYHNVLWCNVLPFIRLPIPTVRRQVAFTCSVSLTKHRIAHTIRSTSPFN